MLSGYDLKIAAFSPDASGLRSICRACAVKRLGENCVQRLEAGLTSSAGEWNRVLGWELADMAVSNGDDCHEPGHTVDEDGHCVACEGVWCEQCGADLDERERVAA